MPGLKFLDCSTTVEKAIQILGISEKPQVGIILGTGFDGCAPKTEKRRCPLVCLPGFADLGFLEGHARELVLTEMAGKQVIMLNGRVHLNESIDGSSIVQVRLQTELLCAMGIKLLILTSSAGRLNSAYNVGDIMFAKDFLRTAGGSAMMPLKPGEFVTPQHAIIDKTRLREISRDIPPSVGLKSHIGCYAFVLGPDIEGKADKDFLRMAGGDVVGMSMAPCACVAAVHQVEVIALSYISNAEDEFSHRDNQDRAIADSNKLVALLTEIVRIA